MPSHNFVAKDVEAGSVSPSPPILELEKSEEAQK